MFKPYIKTSGNFRPRKPQAGLGDANPVSAARLGRSDPGRCRNCTRRRSGLNRKSGLQLEHHGALCRTIEEMPGESEELSRQFKAKYIQRLEAMLTDARAIEV